MSIAARFPVDVRVQVCVGDRTSFGWSEDLSTSGVSAYIPCELEIGQHVKLQLRAPFKSDELELSAVVRNRAGFRYGFEFRDIRFADQEMLVEVCETLKNLEHLRIS